MDNYDAFQIERKRLYEKSFEELSNRYHANTERRSIFLLINASAFLGVSTCLFSISTNFLLLQQSPYNTLLAISWLSFIAAIVFAMVSRWMGQKAISMQIDIAREYYLDGIDEAFERKNKWTINSNITSALGDLLFITGIAFLAFFLLSSAMLRW